MAKGDAETPGGCSADREGQHDVPGEWHPGHGRHGPGAGWEVSVDRGSAWESFCFDEARCKQVFCFMYKSDILISFRLIENVDPEKAVQLYQQTANVFEVSEFVSST